MRLERRADVPLGLVIAAPVAAIAAALILSGGLLLLAAVNPFEAYASILRGALGSPVATAETLTRATPLILTGLAATVAFRAKLWNIGGEGQFYMGAIATAWLGHELVAGLPAAVAVVVMLLGGMAAGALMLLGPALLKVRYNVDEIVTTLLLNFVAILFIGMMIEGPLRDPLAFGWPQSVPVEDDLMLPKLIERTRLHIGLLIGIAASGVVWLMLARTAFGTEARAVGLSRQGSAFAGIPISRTLVVVALVSGSLAGLAGALEVAGVTGYVTTTLSPGFGYTGIVVAMLAALHPVGVVGTAVLAAVMFVGADAMSRSLGAPSFIANVTVAVSLLTMLIALLFTTHRVCR